MPSGLHPVDVIRVAAGGRTRADDVAAVEEPLEIRLNGSPFVVTMRTPGEDEDLAAGFLLSERLIASAMDLKRIERGGDGHVVDVTLAAHARVRVDAALAERRLVTATSACGVCGRRSIDDLMRGVPRVGDGWSMPASAIAALPDRLRAAQAVFDETGGLHAAGLFDDQGALQAAAEDVGRHNAVDKVVGSQLRAGRVPLGNRALCVSGRTSFEIVQKAVVAGIPILAAVSAPSSLAIDLARTANLTLVGFVRGGTFNVYAGEARIAHM